MPHDDIQQRINRYWSRRASSYAQHQVTQLQEEHIRRAWSAVWLDALPASPSDVVDMGTGTGTVAHLVSAGGHRVVGVDLAEGMLRQARATAPAGSTARFQLGDAAAPDFPTGSCDAITARYVLWTLRDTVQALKRWRSILRPGGTLVVVDGPWFTAGVRRTYDHTPASSVGDAFQAAYDERVLRALPLAERSHAHTVRETVAAAGFTDVQLTELTEIYERDKRFGVAPGHTPLLQYRVVARAPGPVPAAAR